MLSAVILRLTFLLLSSISSGESFQVVSRAPTPFARLSRSLKISQTLAPCIDFRSLHNKAYRNQCTCLHLQSGKGLPTSDQSEPRKSVELEIIAPKLVLPEVEWSQYAWFFGILPALSNVFPYLIQQASASTVPEEKRIYIILFLILKRVYLYAIALSSVDIAARRSINLPSKLGKRLQQLNEEIIGSSGPQTTENKEAARLGLPHLPFPRTRTEHRVQQLIESEV